MILKDLVEGENIIRISTRYSGGNAIYYDSLYIFANFKKDADTTPVVTLDTLDIPCTTTVVKDTTTLDTIAQDTTTRDTIAQDTTTEDTIAQDTTRQDTVVTQDTVEPIIVKFMVVYKDDSRIVPVDTNNYLTGQDVSIMDTLASKKDCDFSGWFIVQKDTILKPGEKFKIDTNLTLVATWQSIPMFSITYKRTSGIDGTLPEIKEYLRGSETKISNATVSKSGYNFLCWNTDSTGKGTDYLVGDKIIVANSLVLYAKWEAKPVFTITYKSYGTEGAVPSETRLVEGTETKISSNNLLSKKGHRFLCWNTDSLGKGIDYFSESQVKIVDNLTLYAKWEKNSYKVTFICSDYDFGQIPEENVYEYETLVKIPVSSLVKTGYTFKGWIDSTKTLYKPDDTYKLGAGNVTFNAQWEDPANMVFINSKDKVFDMGGRGDSAYSTEKPMHPVMLTHDLWYDKTEVTQKSFAAIMSVAYPSIYKTPDMWSSYPLDDNLPAFGINWYEAILYCNARTKAAGSTDTVYSYNGMQGTFGEIPESSKLILLNLQIDFNKKGFRLPTEAEWEFAAKGNSSVLYFGEDQLKAIAWYIDDCNAPQKIAQKNSNGYGLFDMFGNVEEWTNDWFYKYVESATPLVDPFHEKDQYNTGIILRGGSFYTELDKVNVTFRDMRMPEGANDETGFRCCLMKD
ncbi:MAG: SUMF1/EgtB/PvdO family nonheme iron enzyme [Candidatus Nanoarchaeia archaeon]|nr:SUMF1/EgtB/PvdO family nonheme iron enzyme [Candidatus Nanoarchaeia archaeon]